MSVWSENFDALRRRFPEVAQRLALARAVAAPRENPPLHDASRVASRWLGGRSWRDGTLLALSGFGDGVHVQALLATLPARASVFVAEDDATLLRATLERSDLRAVFADARLMIGIGTTDDAFFAPLNHAPILEITEVEALVFSPGYNRAPGWYARFFTEFARQVDFRRKLLGTAVVDAALWQANTLENLPLLGAAPDVVALRDVFRERAMVLVSAGPSLDESLDFLREAGRVAVIVAVNSSYRAVRHAGIVPTFVLAADPRGFTARGFADVPLDGTWLVTTPIVDPAVVRLFGERVFTWSGGNPLMTELRRRCGLPPGTTLVEQGTVSACAVDFAAVLGCDRICLVGQDLAVRADGRSHVQDSFYTDLGANRVSVAACRRLPGNTFSEVPVEEKLYVYLKTFEQLVTLRPRLEFLNTARLGARIAGVPYARFEEALRWLGGRDTADIASLVADRHARGDPHRLDPGRVYAALAPTAAYARAVLIAALHAVRLTEGVPDQLAGENGRNMPEVRAALDAVEKLRELLDAHPREKKILEDGRTRLERYRCREAQALITEGTEHWRQILAEREFAWAIAEGAWFLDSHLRKLKAVGGTR